jgi:phospholipid/cholesterol/gamma-HCH transport system substrate-binding protein
METRARYLLVGLFSIAVIAGALGFVYWLHNTGGLGSRAVYQVRFTSPVAGLRAGSAVLFNGIRVGEVTALQLSADDPRQVVATISVQDGTPIRADTQVAVESQGLMGAPSVALRGGSPGATALVGGRGEPGVLLADPSATEDVSQAARDALRLIRGVVAENAEPLRSTMGNLQTFTGALARNSDKLDGIIQGLARLAGGGSENKPVPVYDLLAARDLPPPGKPPQGHLVVPEPTALVLFDTQRILIRGAGGGTLPAANGQWSDSLPKLIQAKVIQTFENAGYGGAVSRPLEGVAADWQLVLDIQGFHVSASGTPEAEVELSAKLLAQDGRIVASQTVRSTIVARSTDAPDAVAGLSEAFGRAATDLVLWTSRNL